MLPGQGFPCPDMQRHSGGSNGKASAVISVFLLDDHELVRAGLRSLIESTEDIVVVGEAATAAEALERTPAVRPDVAIRDVRLPDGSGVEVCREIRSQSVETTC